MMKPTSQPRKSSTLNRIVLGFILVTCFRVWIGPISIEQTAHAMLPNKAAQRTQMLEQAHRTNELLAQIKQVLQSGTLHVRVEGADNQAEKPARKRGQAG